jgi:agmatinase
MQQHPWPTIPDTFLALPPEEHTFERSRVVVLPAPYDAATSYRSGARDGPAAILRASREMEDFDPELGCTPCDVGIATAPALEPYVGGPELMADRVAQAVDAYMSQNKLVCLLGGDHSLTAGAVRAAAQHHPNLSVLVLDAHTDLADEYQGSRFSHACTVRRVLESAPAVLVGVRSIPQEAHTLLQTSPTPLFRREAEPITDTAAIVASLSEDVYVSIDLDVFDPSIMAAVGTPEPGGMGWWEVLRLLRAVAEQRRIVGFDVMELAPAEGPEACAYTAAKLAYKLMAYATALIR